MARRRTRQRRRPEWATGVHLIVYGVLLTVASGLVFLAVSTSAGPSPATSVLALGCAVASTVGGLFILAGIIRWGVQPVIYYQEKLLERMEHQERTRPPSDDPAA